MQALAVGDPLRVEQRHHVGGELDQELGQPLVLVVEHRAQALDAGGIDDALVFVVEKHRAFPDGLVDVHRVELEDFGVALAGEDLVELGAEAARRGDDHQLVIRPRHDHRQQVGEHVLLNQFLEHAELVEAGAARGADAGIGRGRQRDRAAEAGQRDGELRVMRLRAVGPGEAHLRAHILARRELLAARVQGLFVGADVDSELRHRVDRLALRAGKHVVGLPEMFDLVGDAARPGEGFPEPPAGLHRHHLGGIVDERLARRQELDRRGVAELGLIGLRRGLAGVEVGLCDEFIGRHFAAGVLLDLDDFPVFVHAPGLTP